MVFSDNTDTENEFVLIVEYILFGANSTEKLHSMNKRYLDIEYQIIIYFSLLLEQLMLFSELLLPIYT